MQQLHPPSLSIMGWNITGDLGPLTAYTSQRGNTVWFDKTNPLNPPSLMQTKIRNLIRLAATSWRAQTPAEREAWNQAAARAHLTISGYNLWTWFQRHRDLGTLRTIERQSGVTLPNV